ncbi:hypothetical protein F2P79_022040 [Pimephales promelas]|nr:hypothetical protein F2P79_022040 [Pimephales promelas]
MLRKKRIKPEQDAKEHILSDKDKAFIEGRQINTFKGRDEEVTYNYGDSSWPWRLRELCDETSVAVTECSVNPSSSVKQKELCDETSVAVTECSVNPSSSVKQKELCDETSVAVTECSVNPSSTVKQKELCDETSVAVTECSVNPSSSVKQKEKDK